jgi:signal transduction histidine kinase/ligand-binding sensor domain-containing protein
MWLLQSVSAVAAALVIPSGALALPPDLRIAQLYRTAWTAKDGAPTGIESLAQTSDGYLWIAAAAGLFRFDGVRFERVDSLRGQRLPSSNVMTLFAPRAGGLWVGYRFGGASFIEDGRITSYGEPEGLVSGSVTHFAQDDAGIVWATTARGLKRFDGRGWQDVAETLNLSSEYVKVLHAARDGTLWIVIGHAVMALRRGQSVFEATAIHTSDAELDFVEAPDGTLWLTDASFGAHVVYVPDGAPPVQQGWIDLHAARREPMWGRLIDRDGALWMAAPNGIHRLPDVRRLLEPDPAPPGPSHDTFAAVDGLTAPLAAAFLEDREGNVWIGTTSGLNRFRESRLTRAELPRSADGFAIVAADDGALLVGVDLDDDDSMFRIDGTSAGEPIRGPRRINCAYRADDGVVWLGGHGMLWHSSGSRWIPMSLPVDRANADFYPVQAIARDRSGVLWVSVVRGGVFRLADDTWTRVDDPPLSLAAGAADGRVWLGYPKNRLAVREADSDAVREFSAAEGLDLGNIMSILPRPRETWVGGELGLARFDGQRFHAVTRRGGRQLPSVSGIVATADGDLWLNTSEGAMRIAAGEVQRLSVDPRSPVRYTLLDFRDGMPGTPTSIRPLPSIAAGTDGRVWFATTTGIVWIDPQRQTHNTLPPNVEVQAVVADGTRYEPAAGLRLPIRTRDLQVSYTASSLSIPERVRFRYRLGAAEPWQDAGNRRVAYFTNLTPGDYTFRVAAANEDGVWNETGAAIAFTIPPAFYQTRWFYASCVLAALALLTASYRVRVRQVAAQVRGRLEARLAERERIARDLHDTLLQGMQGLIWRFQAATDRIPPGEPARQLMEQSLDRADKLLEESRDKVKDLRPAARDVADLAQALATEGEQFAKLHSAKFRVSVQGAARELHPIVREEGLLIGREALANAFRHAGAADIEAEVTYGDGALHVRIRDDGRGISAAVLDAGGKPGHFGLLGMRERAKKLGAHLEVWSKPGAGTEIDLRVPAEVAYRRPQPESRGVRSWLGATS